MGNEHNLSGKQAFLRVQEEISKLPRNEILTKKFCDQKRFSRILIIDGKYVAVKGFSRKIPFIYAIDYLTHDIPFGSLYVSEDEMSFSRFFSQLKRLGYYPDIVVADDRGGLNSALLKVFPYSLLQLCHNHYLENIRTLLKVRSTEKYRQFFFDLKEKVFDDRIDPKKSLRSFSQSSPCFNRLIKNILGTIRYREDVLFNYISVSDCPNNTNLIELYNSHLNGRLKTIKGFQSFDSANRWLNAWIIRRRTKSFTDCEGRFQYLNGHSSFSLSIKKQTPWSDSLTQLGILPIEFFEKNRGKNQLKR